MTEGQGRAQAVRRHRRQLRAALEYYVLSAPLLVLNLAYRQYRPGSGPETPDSASRTALAQFR